MDEEKYDSLSDEENLDELNETNDSIFQRPWRNCGTVLPPQLADLFIGREIVFDHLGFGVTYNFFELLKAGGFDALNALELTQ